MLLEINPNRRPEVFDRWFHDMLAKFGETYRLLHQPPLDHDSSTMQALKSSWLLMVVASLIMAAGCSGPLAKIREVDQPKEAELRVNWKSYHTYCLKDYAILFQLKGDTTIQKEGDWREVTSDETASRCASFFSHSSPVNELLGENGTFFGYIIYNPNDGVSAVIIDPKTIRLFYHVHPKGP